MSVDSQRQLHERLARFNVQRLRPALPDAHWRATLASECESRLLEGEFVEEGRRALAGLDVPDDADAFMRWYEDLCHTGPGQGDALFPFLARRATLEQMRWFLVQEIAGEAGFDDLVALTQLRVPERAKLELARNYWDEMGRGHAKGMHGPMLAVVAEELALVPAIETTVWESLALANLMAALAANRRYAWHAIGALGVIEMTAPGRVAQVNAGLRRLGVSPRGRRYFQLHAGLDIKHSAAWNREIIQPLVAADPQLARPIAEGALLRLSAGARCFARYRAHLHLAVPQRRRSRDQSMYPSNWSVA
ncbi:MAG TPA: iron-containing redox enzyme family protein [Verrucomicrobiae bacterium]|nr:iron-containing redox enzyme family protein [Verrucomicrobiae bacterium]